MLLSRRLRWLCQNILMWKPLRLKPNDGSEWGWGLPPPWCLMNAGAELQKKPHYETLMDYPGCHTGGERLSAKEEEEEKQWDKTLLCPPPHASPSSSIPLKWIILVILVTGRGLDFDLCSSKAKIKESISCYFMAVGMMNGPVSGPKQAAVSLPRILIAKVAGHCSRFNTQWEPEGPARSPLVTSAAACFSNVTAVSAARPPRNS